MPQPSTAPRQAIAALAAELEVSAVIKGQRARFLAKRFLAAPSSAHAAVLTHVAQVYGPAVAHALNDAYWLVVIDRLLPLPQNGVH